MNIQRQPLATLEYPRLLSPFTLAGKRLKNRIVHAAMSTRYGKNGEVTQRFIDYHVNRIKGGTAMTITEPMALRRGQASDTRIRVWDQTNMDGLKRMADAVLAADGHLLTQIQDPGRGNHKPGRKMQALGPSALPDDWSWTVPHALKEGEIREMVGDFAYSARKLKTAGFSGVEISGGHGHIFHQFLSPWSNRRDDDYGGAVENRCRLIQDVIDAVRAECGKGFILGLRLPGDDGMPGGVDPDEAERITRVFASRRQVDYFCWVQGSHSRTLDMHLPDMHWERATFFPLIKRLRDAAKGVPCGAVGRILEPAQGEALLRDQVGELVMMSRTLLTDPAWGLKAAQNRDNDIRKCVSCNNCWGVINLEQPLKCDNNPRAGLPDEVDWWPQPAARKQNVVVVGGGIAGLEAAWVAAARGHRVTLFSASSELGGKTRLNALLPGSDPLSSIYDFQQVMAKKAGVRYELGVRADAAAVLALAPDAVVLATGSTMSWPTMLPAAWQEEGWLLDLRTITAELLAHPVKQPGTAVIFDMDGLDGTYSAAEFMRDKFDRVVILTPREAIARDEPLVRQQSVYRRIYGRRIDVQLLSEPTPKSRFEEGVLVYRNVINGDEGEIDDVALFTYATPRVPDLALQAPLEAAGVKVHVVGDAYMPRNVMAATGDGNAVGNAI
jgi:2,4-dienoyl-CoA reductase-like NADH-dependent reductase (Old Yellow Enzyme family)/thioredoxin reductase